MRKAAQLLTILLTMVALTNGVARAEIDWQNPRTARNRAQAEGKLLLLHFYAEQMREPENRPGQREDLRYLGWW